MIRRNKFGLVSSVSLHLVDKQFGRDIVAICVTPDTDLITSVETNKVTSYVLVFFLCSLLYANRVMLRSLINYSRSMKAQTDHWGHI